ncbi:unnamed protein product [Parajaminaea phylloscopi]
MSLREVPVAALTSDGSSRFRLDALLRFAAAAPQDVDAASSRLRRGRADGRLWSGLTRTRPTPARGASTHGRILTRGGGPSGDAGPWLPDPSRHLTTFGSYLTRHASGRRGRGRLARPQLSVTGSPHRPVRCSLPRRCWLALAARHDMVQSSGELQEPASERTPLLPKDVSRTHSHLIERDDIESRWRRWKQRVTKGKQRASDRPEWLISVFQGSEQAHDRERTVAAESYVRSSDAHIAQEVEGVRSAIEEGIHPRMIQTGSSGSYFAKRRDPSTGKLRVSGVFKPSDEEPYGNLNPKRAFLRRYFWWALGRPCLVPGFSAMSEAGASLLDDRLQLGLVPKTQLVSLSSTSFHYSYRDRQAFEELGHELPQKIGSFQTFLHDYVMVSTFLRRNPFPSRPLSVFERDLAAEQRAHRKSRKRKSTKLRQCSGKLKYLLLCRGDLKTLPRKENGVTPSLLRQEEEDLLIEEDDAFLWTPELIQSFRLELEKLVVFDYLLRNTDRGFDNFMVRHVQASANGQDGGRLVLGAIDNSLAWPLKHPDGIRDYPYGWLYLPSEIIGGPFSQVTRQHFLPLLTSPQWWHTTVTQLRQLFERDEHFQEKLFDSQMAVFKGQGWNIVASLQDPGEGPLELCARPKKVVHQSVKVVPEREVQQLEKGKVPLEGCLSDNGFFSHARPAAVAKPIAIADSAEAAPNAPLESLHPRSLPETSTLSLRHRDHVSPAVASVTGKAGPQASSLGIEVLEGLRQASKARRPRFSKGLSGFDLGRRQPGAPRRAPSQSRPSQHARGYSETLSEADGEDLASDDEELDTGGVDAAMARMTQSDYFAQHQRQHQARRDALPTIESALSGAGAEGSEGSRGHSSGHARTPSQDAAASLRDALKQGEVSSAGSGQNKEHVGTTTEQSGPADPSQRRSDAASAARAAARPNGGRRRMRSVGQWSISSFGSRPEADTPGPAEEAGARPVKVIVESLIDDRSLPWQAWLRA